VSYYYFVGIRLERIHLIELKPPFFISCNDVLSLKDLIAVTGTNTKFLE